MLQRKIQSLEPMLPWNATSNQLKGLLLPQGSSIVPTYSKTKGTMKSINK